MHAQTDFSLDFLVAECVEVSSLGHCADHGNWRRDDWAVNRPVVTLCPRQPARIHQGEDGAAGMLQALGKPRFRQEARSRLGNGRF